MMRDRHYNAPAQLVFCNKFGTNSGFAINRIVSADKQLVALRLLFPERWHLAFDPSDNHLVNPGVASVQSMQIGSLVAARIVSMAMRAIH